MLPDEPLVPEYFLTGPLMVSLSLGTTATRAWWWLAICLQRIIFKDGCSERRTVGAAALALAVVAVIVASDQRSLDVSRVGDGLAEAVSGERHGC